MKNPADKTNDANGWAAMVINELMRYTAAAVAAAAAATAADDDIVLTVLTPGLANPLRTPLLPHGVRHTVGERERESWLSWGADAVFTFKNKRWRTMRAMAEVHTTCFFEAEKHAVNKKTAMRTSAIVRCFCAVADARIRALSFIIRGPPVSTPLFCLAVQ
jgi:hypothetical protein